MVLLLACAVIFAICVWLHVTENRQIAKDYKDKLDWPVERWLLRFSWSRSIQFLSALAAAMAIAVIYIPKPIGLFSAPSTDQQQPVQITAPQPIVAPTTPKTPQPQTPAAAPIAPPEPKVVDVPASEPAPEQTHVTQSALDDALGGTAPKQLDQQLTAVITQPDPPQEQKPTVSASPNTPPKPTSVPQAMSSSTAQTVDDVYNPEKRAGDIQSNMDDIKKRYEDILVIYMFLKKCGRAKDADYNVIISALGQEMASVNAPSRMQYDVLTSAQGSYKELYSKSACDGAGIDGLTLQYNDYIKALEKTFPAL